jgi:RNA polymerase sigma-70 factor (ECF subfamily)
MFTSPVSDAAAAEGSGNRSPGAATNERVHDDAELIRRVAAGDEEAFRLLYGRHTGAVYSTLLRLVGRTTEASDLMQEAWLRAVRHLALFRGQSAFRTWLTGIALNCYREWRRKHTREVVGTDADIRPSPATWGDELAAINQVLSQLPYEHREAIVLHDIEGFTHEEIAAALEIEPGTSKSRLSRARRAFRQRWQGTR